MMTVIRLGRAELARVTRRGKAYVGFRKPGEYAYNITVIAHGPEVLAPTYRIEVLGSDESDAAQKLVAEEERDYNTILRAVMHEFPDADENMIEFFKYVKEEPRILPSDKGVRATTEIGLIAFA